MAGATAAALLVSMLGLAIIAAIGLPERPTDPVSVSGVTAARLVPPLPAPWPLSLAEHAARTVEGEFHRGDTFASVLRSAGVSATLIDQLARAVQPDFNVKRIRSGRPYKIYFAAHDELLLFRYQPDRQRAILVAEGRRGWGATEIVVPYDIRPRFIHAVIRGSLEGALAATWMGRSDAIRLSHKLAGIFAWDIDFAADLRVNDTVDVVVEQRFLEGGFVGFGDVLAAELRIAGRTYNAVRYVRPGTAIAYFTPTGESLQRAFLRSPVDFTRISSRFSYRRMHPVLNVVRAHRGVDYVAPAGTPVHATATGTVTYVGRNAQAGNHVKIRHGGSYTSWYLHLSRPADGLEVGDKVEQGEVLGYVGRTGLATSNHLHYQLEQGGTFVDPLSIDFPANAPLPSEQMAEFALQRGVWISRLREGQIERPVVLAGSGE
ncbi:MAG: M23 family metallopeptidase [Acidobacteria bacterium]|nr:M23 family metallopeptidase [Acidobacteriota bacterium]